MLASCEMALDVRRAEQWMSVADAFARRSNFVPIGAICRMHCGGILTTAGRWTEAEQELTTSIRIHDAGYRGRAGSVVRLADLRVRQGRLEEAARFLEGYEHDSYASRAIGRLHLARGEVKLAQAVLRRDLRRQEDAIQRAPVLALLVEVEAAAGRLEEARTASSELWRLAEELRAPVMRTLAELSAGTVCRAAGLPEGAEHLEASAEGFGAAGLPLEQAAARLQLAHLLAATSPEVAIAEARVALECFERLSARREADRAASFLRSLGASGRNRPRTAGTLTKREAQVLALLAEGLSNNQAAERLFISPRTAEHHVSSILAKLGLSSRAEAVAYALRNG